MLSRSADRMRCAAALALVAGTVPAIGARAQDVSTAADGARAAATAGVDVAFSRPYVWRGVTLASRGTVQPAAWAALDWRGNEIAGGAWAAVEPWRARDEDVTGAGRNGDRLAETNYWLQNTRRFGGIDVTLGAIAYRHHGDAAAGGTGPGADATELYLRLWPVWEAAPVEPRIAVYRALEREGASYVDLSLSRSVPILPFFFPPDLIGDVLLSASTAASFPSAPARGVHLEGTSTRRGISHVALSAAGTVVISGPVYAHFGLHGQRNLTAETRRVTARREADWKGWFEAGLSISRRAAPADQE
jgi:hypothetical protein